MSTWEIGNTLQAGLKIKNSAGALADLGGGDPTCTVTLPDATTTAATVTKTATGTYSATLTATQAGRHRFTWDGSGDNSGGLPHSDVLDVWPADPRLIIGLADARAALNIPTSDTSDDDEIRLYVAATTAVIEDIVGPVLSATETLTVSGRGRYSIILPHIPSDVATVTEDGTSLTEGTQWVWDESGIVWRGSQPHAATWSDTAPRNVVITYSVGASTVPNNLILAAREELRFLWQVGQQAARPGFGDIPGPDVSYTPTGFAVPNRVIELCRPSMAGRAPGMA